MVEKAGAFELFYALQAPVHFTQTYTYKMSALNKQIH